MSNDTQELIAILGHLPPTRKAARMELYAVPLVAAAAVATWLWLGLRPELVVGDFPLSFWVKTFILTAICAISMRGLAAASLPLAAPQSNNVAVILGLCVVALVGMEWVTIDHRNIVALFLLPNFAACLQHVSLYGIVGMVIFTLLARHYAPTDYTRCAGLIGLAAAAIGAVGYSIHCPVDSPTFIVIAYGIPMLGLLFAGRMLLPRFLRW